MQETQEKYKAMGAVITDPWECGSVELTATTLCTQNDLLLCSSY